MGKQISSDTYQFSALRIPFGKAAYMSHNVIHNDVYLQGRYRAIYGLPKGDANGPGGQAGREVRISTVVVRDADWEKCHMI